MKVVVDGKSVRVKKPATVEELLFALGIDREEVLVKINGKLAADKRKIHVGDDVRVMRVVFGG